MRENRLQWDANIEWWYFFSFLKGNLGGKYAVMASFFRVGETQASKGHYLIFSLIDLNKPSHQAFSLADRATRRNLLLYLTAYLLKNPKDLSMWRLYSQLLTGNLPKPHSNLKSVSFGERPFRLVYGDSLLSFYGQGENAIKAHLAAKDTIIDLRLEPLKPVTPVGGDGKPDSLYYYSLTRHKVEGEIVQGTRREIVKGAGWYDRQWGHSQDLLVSRGWNWFGVQLEDGREIIINQFHSIASGQPLNAWAHLVEADGQSRFCRNVALSPLAKWQSPSTKATYPISWLITFPDWHMELIAAARFPEQEMPILGPLQAIWEGACSFTGKVRLAPGITRSLHGQGFMELVGYQKHH